MNTRLLAALLLFLVAAAGAAEEGGPLVANGTFEELDARAGAPAFWAAAGAPAVQQRFTADAGHAGGRSGKLECTAFDGDGPAAHAMIAQSGRVAVRRGQWYRLTFWARAEQLKAGAVDLALNHTRPWENAGLSEAFTPQAQWERFEFLFRATHDVDAPNSRLQFWFKSTGTLWLDDVELTESKEGEQWFPQIATAGMKNFLPNSSFECGAANWGSFSSGLRSGWSGNLFRLEGEVDAGTAHHGRHSLKIALSPETLPVTWFDYYEPVRQPVRRVLAANHGWLQVTPGEPLTLSVFMRADADGVPGQLAASEPGGRVQTKAVSVGREWRRYDFTFKPQGPSLFIAAGLDLEGSKRAAAVLWLDALQLERGEHASDYAPRAPVESFVATAAAGNIFTQPENGATFTVRAFNDGDRAATVNGTLVLTDFFDRAVFTGRPALALPAHAGGSLEVGGVGRERRGFFRAEWTTPGVAQALRCAIIEPIPPGTADSPLGFNHAYPWEYLVTLARQAGIVWWRDWSAQWQTIEREPGTFDWSKPDAQIDRVRALDSQVDVLIPFPSANWSSSAPEEVLKKAASGRYPDNRLPAAYASKAFDEFGRFAADVVRHYGADRAYPVQTFQILNESVYTDYALPGKFGYTVDDYIRLLAGAYRAMKAANPNCRVVAGCGNPPAGSATREFIEKGGLRNCDVFDVHLYNPPVPAETYDETFRKIEDLMRAHGGLKPIWMTEWGCYADDDPACLPNAVGDASMNRSKWSSERAATEHIVKFVAVTFAHGMRKIFFHAGTAGTINGPDAGGVLFEYGGAPRKMYAGVAALTRLLGTPETCLGSVDRDGLRAYAFASRGQAVAVAWRSGGAPRAVTLAAGQRAFDVMGNELPRGEIVLGDSPLYVVAPAAGGEALLAALGRA